MTTPKDEQQTLMAGYNIALDDLSNWAKVKYVATGDEAWLSLAVEFFQDVGHRQDAGGERADGGNG